jgi:hypothetical protein
MMETPKRLGHDIPVRRRGSNWLRQGITALGGLVVLSLMFMFSLVVFALLLGFALVFGGYAWWRTRELRRQLKAHHAQWPARGSGSIRVVEGEVIRESPPETRIE